MAAHCLGTGGAERFKALAKVDSFPVPIFTIWAKVDGCRLSASRLSEASTVADATIFARRYVTIPWLLWSICMA